jgi:hypothetical protein
MRRMAALIDTRKTKAADTGEFVLGEISMQVSLRDNPEHWRSRAEEARVQAEQMHDASSRRTMLEIASGYDRLAGRTELRREVQKTY